MLVLALEFSRGCTAHAGAGTLTAHASITTEAAGQTARPGHARGERSPPAARKTRARSRTDARTRGAPEGLDSETGHCTHPGLRRAPEGRHRDRPEGPLPQNGIVRVPIASAGTDP